jgi:hypothetical protein
LVYNVCAIPDDDVSEFVATFAEFLNERNVDRDALILPPHIRNIDDTVGFGTK